MSSTRRGLGGQRCPVQCPIHDGFVDLVCQSETLLFPLVVGHQVGAFAEGMVTAAVLVLVIKDRGRSGGYRGWDVRNGNVSYRVSRRGGLTAVRRGIGV